MLPQAGHFSGCLTGTAPRHEDAMLCPFDLVCTVLCVALTCFTAPVLTLVLLLLQPALAWFHTKGS